MNPTVDGSASVAEPPAQDLTGLRLKIDAVDQSLVNLLNERANISIGIGMAKRAEMKRKGLSEDEQKTHVHIPAREVEVYQKIKSLNHGPLSDDAVHAIYREIMSASISLQKDVTIAFLGPKGTFTHQVAYERFGDSVGYSEQTTIADVFAAVDSGAATYGVVPFENSTFGSVTQTLDSFIINNVQVRAEDYLSIHHCLLGNTPLEHVKRIYSHPEAFGQCQRWLKENAPHAERITVASTGLAAEMAAKEKNAAAICSRVCSELYGVDIIEKNIEDLKNNTTRFFIIGDKSESPTKDDRTLMYFTVDHRQPGALCDALNVIKNKNINLTKIDSRPSRQRLWHYIFFIEMEGHVDNTNVREAVSELKNFCLDVKILGSYPNHRRVETP
ncbi:Prephenate dehydratase-domain-containing protein [Polychytrium aggregatum]|uniref:Prephenate dehydratase-domain-containing protein n=1 Tax=Polychytrium aggregatum TaxID=110093 RepID=UPI0022FE7422|nr:Prephenate dehydratase-domain-containing protein [Polychytrium aggregatum]KAI9209257.1 Prephenate dehydratase-domain-containing protein [Polychytrium aggregatum]